MSPVLRPAFALALAGTALASTTALPAAADDPEPFVQHCYTQALTPEEVAAGEYSVIECFEVEAGTPLEEAQRGNVIVARLWDISDTTGAVLTIDAVSCSGASWNPAPTDWWNDKVSATTLVSCGFAKHWTGAGYSGSNELKSGVGYHTFSGGMNNTTSSIQYAP